MHTPPIPSLLTPDRIHRSTAPVWIIGRDGGVRAADLAQVLEERDGDTDVLQVRYTYGDDLISQTRGPDPLTDIWYYHYDGQMSTRQLTNGSAAVTDTYTYDAFGNLLTPMGPTPNNYLYTGEQYDPNVGFYYLRARYYNQALGRFINRDPFGGSVWDPASLHRYTYTGSDPINRIDPSGRFFTYISLLATNLWASMISQFDAFRVLLAIQAFRAAVFLFGGVHVLVRHGQRLLQWLSGRGQQGFRALQNMFLRTQGSITQGQAELAPRFVRTQMNQLLTGGNNNPTNIQWHHIVGTTRGILQFGQSAINSMANVVPTPTHIHVQISQFYSRGHVLLPQYSTLRDWMSALTYEEQFRYGLQIWQNAMRMGGSTSWQPPI